MKVFILKWAEYHSIEVEAESEEDALEKYQNGEIDLSESSCDSSELTDHYELHKMEDE